MEIHYLNKSFHTKKGRSIHEIQQLISTQFNVCPEDFYLLTNGKKLDHENNEDSEIIHVVPRILGGKGGFGSMLRAIGAQIEKTTNREACRDLSGRRLRDINEEERLKNWIAAQAEREKEREERKRKKLERLCEEPKHEFKDENYYKERSELPEKVADAVEQGMKAAMMASKRKLPEADKVEKKKRKRAAWADDLDCGSDSSSDSDDDSESSEGEQVDSSEAKNKHAKGDVIASDESLTVNTTNEDTKAKNTKNENQENSQDESKDVLEQVEEVK